MDKERFYNELDDLNQKINQPLKELQSDGEKASDHPAGVSFRKLVLKVILFGFSLIIPFFVLIRFSVFMYLQYNFNGWLALLSGVIVTVLLLMMYWLLLSSKFQGKINTNKYIRRGIAALVVAYTFYGLLYYSEMNTKNETVNNYYRSLHPIIRVALSTVTLADSDVLVTDIYRKPEDYARMGLAQNQKSLHYVQADGYIHAIDLRTKGRTELSNLLSQLAFNMAGLQTIRHVGTADHLHVYLPLNQ